MQDGTPWVQINDGSVMLLPLSLIGRSNLTMNTEARDGGSTIEYRYFYYHLMGDENFSENK